MRQALGPGALGKPRGSGWRGRWGSGKNKKIIKIKIGTSLVVQWLRLCAPNTGGPGLIPGRGTRSHKPQLSVFMLQRKLCEPKLRPNTAKIINKYKKNKGNNLVPPSCS